MELLQSLNLREVMQHFHANSSLPRSGSELLQSLLSQHPSVYVSATSPVLEYWYGALSNFAMSEVKSQDPILMRTAFINFCKSGTVGYYEAITDRPVVIDKSRGWLQYGEMLWNAFPAARIVCMTRKVDDIVASLERLYQANVGHPETRTLPIDPRKRAEAWMASGSLPLGLALDRIRDRRSKGPDERIMYVDYDYLVNDPVEVMLSVFRFLNLAEFKIDSENLTKGAAEDDSYYGIFGSHKVRKTVSRRPV